MGWASDNFFKAWTWLMAFCHFFSCLGYQGPLGLMGLGPLADYWGVGVGLPWTEKTGLYRVFFGQGLGRNQDLEQLQETLH